MAFGIYVHIPYCIQKCTYCDFATYEQSRTIPIADYQSLLLEEIRQNQGAFPKGPLTSVYFGGGTPSLAPPSMIIDILNELAKFGFEQTSETEITIEINPGTLSIQKIETYLRMGINRFSVGVQTFEDHLLKSVKREHNSQSTRETLRELQTLRTNFSTDLLFGLPSQNLFSLKQDLEELLLFDPTHVSAYCLTVHEGHSLFPSLLPEMTQVEMYQSIEAFLIQNGFYRYELSSYSKPGFESRHNHLYWSHQNYWGLGMSSHSYLAHSPWGLRFWNPATMGAYKKQIEQGFQHNFTDPLENLPLHQYEKLKKHEALTDFCHVSFRKIQGLDLKSLTNRFDKTSTEKVLCRLQHLIEKGWVTHSNDSWKLTEQGRFLSNQVFLDLTFLATDLP